MMGGTVSRQVGSRAFLISAAGFILVLATAESLCRAYQDRLAVGEEHIYREKRRALREMSPPGLLILGDSAAHRGLVPDELARSPGRSVYNAAIPSASGIVQLALARAVTWRPPTLIFAGVPVEVVDTWTLQRHERHDIAAWQRLRWPEVSGDVLLSGLSELYARRKELRAGLASWVSSRGRRFDPSPVEASAGDALGWLRPDAPAIDRAALARSAETKMAIWFERPGVVGHVRMEALVEALMRWSDDRTARLLVLMPLSSPLRGLLAQRPEAPVIQARWNELAQRTGSRFLDCSAALPDDRFFDEDHLDEPGARALSRDLALALETGQPRLCLRVR